MCKCLKFYLWLDIDDAAGRNMCYKYLYAGFFSRAKVVPEENPNAYIITNLHTHVWCRNLADADTRREGTLRKGHVSGVKG